MNFRLENICSQNDALLASDRRGVEKWATNEDELCTQRQGLDDVGPAANTAIKHHYRFRTYPALGPVPT